jgi:hypothetical protein
VTVWLNVCLSIDFLVGDDLALDRHQWRALVNTAMNLLVP